MKHLILFALIFSSAALMAQNNTIHLSKKTEQIKIQRVHDEAFRDTVIVINDFDFPVMMANTKTNKKGHKATMAPPNYMKPGEKGMLIITADPESEVRPYNMQFEAKILSATDREFSHIITIEVEAELNSK